MSKKNRNRPLVARKTPTPPVSSRPATETDVDKLQDRRITRTQIVTAISLALSMVSVALTLWMAKSAADANKIAQAAQDRTSGRTQARFELVEEKNRDNARMKQFMRKKDGSEDEQVFRIENADELMRWSPYVLVKNTGSEPIDAIKIDVKYQAGAAYGVGVRQIAPPPIVVNDSSTYEATAFGKLMPGQTATVSLTPVVLNQIQRLNLKDYADKDHLGIFTIRAYCRLVGGSSYDRTSEDQTEVLTFHWRPAGFKPDAPHVKELLDVKPQVTIVE